MEHRPSDSRVAAAEAQEANSSLVRLGVISLIAGAAAGLLGGVFRLLLERADVWRSELIVWAHQRPIVGFAIVAAGCALATATAAWMVRRWSPESSGSGIPHVEAVLEHKLPQAPVILIPVKFVGGALAIGAGLALGREGPSVQMGASAAEAIGRVSRLSESDRRVLLAAGAGAGLATAFNAPIAGAVFVLEELVRRFDTRITIAVFGASAGAISVSRLLLGDAPDFDVAPLPYPSSGSLPAYLVLGILLGLLGLAYNRAILGALNLAQGMSRVPIEVRGAIIGFIVAVIAWFAPHTVGGGDMIAQRTLDDAGSLLMLTAIFVVRFALGPISYAALTPGGLFAPILALGAIGGMLVGKSASQVLPNLEIHPTAFAVVSMAAFFTATVRAPVTGIILLIEMTGCFTLLLPMLVACFACMLIPTLLGGPPIYDSLLERRLRALNR